MKTTLILTLAALAAIAIAPVASADCVDLAGNGTACADQNLGTSGGDVNVVVDAAGAHSETHVHAGIGP